MAARQLPLLTVLALLWLGLPRPGLGAPASSPAADGSQSIVLPKAVPDPLEPINRGLWAVNEWLMKGVVKPTAKGYRAVVRTPVRKAIRNFSRNLTYPDRVVNNLLEAKWAGARDETYRFACNTVLGVGGFIDIASRWSIPKSDATFGDTFGQWGWKPDFFLMLPVGGPSNDRDTVGSAADSAANPLRYFSPYPYLPSRPLSYLSPYDYFVGASAYNGLSDTVDGLVRLTKTQMDAYSEIEYAWTFERKSRVLNYHIKEQKEPESATLETLQSVAFSFRNPKFPGRGKTGSVFLPDTGRRLRFNYWLQPRPAPVVYIVPGLGSHRLADTVLALAELVYDHGFSAVSISSPFNYEFMEQAATVTVPGYTPVDVHDLHVALTRIDAYLRKAHRHRLGETALLGYSMGAFQSLYLAATQSTNRAPLLQFERYVAIDCPVRLLYGMAKLDEFYRAPLAWPAAQRTQDIEDIFLKVATLAGYSLTPQTTLPFNSIESRFLIGLVFRYILRDAIYTSQRLHNMGVLKLPLSKWRREPVYHEILQYSFDDYLEKFVIPYYSKRGIDLSAPGALDRASDLRTYQSGLRSNRDIRLIVNQNDFLLAPGDLQWFQSTLLPGEMTVFPSGGHLGNLGYPAVQEAILKGLQGLEPPPVAAEH